MRSEEIQFLTSRFGSIVAKMPDDSIFMVVAELAINGKPSDVPTIVVRGHPGSRLSTSQVNIRLSAFHTPFCPVVTMDVIFPFQEKAFVSSYWTFLPMNSPEQRSLLRIITKARFWFLVVFSGGLPTKSMLIPIGQRSSQSYKEAWRLISQYPVDPNANADRAVEAVMRLIDRVVPGFEPLDVSQG